MHSYTKTKCHTLYIGLDTHRFFTSQPADSFTFFLMSHYFPSGVSRLLAFVLSVKANRMLSLCSYILFIFLCLITAVTDWSILSNLYTLALFLLIFSSLNRLCTFCVSPFLLSPSIRLFLLPTISCDRPLLSFFICLSLFKRPLKWLQQASF